MVSYMWPDKRRKFQKMVQVFFVLGNQYLLKVTSLTLSTIIAVEVSALLVKRQGICSFKINAAALKLGLDGKRGHEKEKMKNSCLVVQLNLPPPKLSASEDPSAMIWAPSFRSYFL